MASVFEFPVAYIESLANFTPLLAGKARDAGVKGLAVKTYDAGGESVLILENRGALRTRGATLKQMGFVLGGWACPRRDPAPSAQQCSDLYTELGLSFQVFETEYEYKTDGGKVDLRRLLAPWRTVRPRAVTGLAVEGGQIPVFQNDVAMEYGCYLLPETYYRVHGSYDAHQVLWQATRYGWSRYQVKVAASGVEGHSMCESLLRVWDAYSAFTTETGQPTGYMLWRGDMLNAEDYRLVGLCPELSA